MKRYIYFVMCLLMIFNSSGHAQELGVMTFNIRYDNPADNEYNWNNRKEMVFAVFQNYIPEIICLQEALKGQVDQIQFFLKGYKNAGVGRDDGREAGEFLVIFYDSLRFVLNDGATFWLSETPDIPGSRSWNAACTRIVTWVKLFDKIENRYLLVFNTHFDHISEQARIESARLLLNRIKEIAGPETVILTGDFNTTDTSGVYKILTGHDSVYPMNDTRKLAGKNSDGPAYSFIGFPFNPAKDEIIDFIFISGNSDLRVMKSSIIDFHRKDKYPSDHLPVMTQFEYLTYVNPFIGTGGHGHTYPGASLPFGMVQVSPDTRLDGWDGCSGYHASDSIIYGFSHTHLSGTGCSDYGDILIMPAVGNIKLINYGYASSFDKSTESASPGYYKVDLAGSSIKAELTATQRAGFHRYTFPQTDQAGIVIDLKHRDKVLESSLKIVANDEIEGMRISQAWAVKQMVYYVIRFSKPFSSYSIESKDELFSDIKEFSSDNIKGCFMFSTRKGEQILVKVGISAVSVEGARKNLDAEISGWDFDNVANQALLAWNKELKKIEVKGGSSDQKTIFYTSLYHALLSPNLYMDVDGKYRGRDLLVHEAKGFDYYTVFSLWDTYRAAHPLFTIIDQKRTNDFINTFLCQYEQGGMLPVWELSANETGCMIGYHSVPVIADAYIKGIRNYNIDKAFKAMKHSAEQDHLGLKYHRFLGFIPGEMEGESVSKTLEYAYDDWCIAQVAKSMGKMDDYSTYIRRAQNYKNLFDGTSGFMRAKMNGTWFSPFDPAEVNFNYTEANAWQYSFYVPQDLDGLIGLHGGKEKFALKLDAMFSASSITTGRDQSDITGLIGQYAHGNEPSHHMAYLYDYAGQPWKTQELVHRICNELYTNNSDGLCGNEDCGQMSSWFVLSAMGFYPVTPCSDVYAIGTPLFEEATINLENGKKFIIKATNLNEQNFYIQSASLNGIHYNRSFIIHSDIMKGGELVFMMGNAPNKNWGTLSGDYPVSAIRDHLITPVPSIEQGQRSFMDSTVISLACLLPQGKIYYTLDGTEPTLKSELYQSPILIRENRTLKAMAYSEDMPTSAVIEAQFSKIPKNRKIKLLSRYASQYSGGGENALIDFIRGGGNFRTGTWQGYEGVDLVAVIDLGSEQPVYNLSLGCFQDQGSWIFMPVEVDFYFSKDGTTFNLTVSVKNDIDEHESNPVIKEFTANFNGIKTRYLKVVARNRSICPAWHPGAGNKSWIFCDEIVIE